MPGRDGTGPFGMGFRSGRGLGFCARTVATVARPCLGFGLGYGLGRGRANFVGSTISKDQLIAQRDALKASLEAIDKQISEQ